MNKIQIPSILGQIILLLGFLVLNSITSFGQPYARMPLEERKQKSLELLKSAPYIVEGKAVGKVRTFYGDDGKTIYREVPVLLIHDYKGNLNCDTISVIIKGGTMKNFSANGIPLPPDSQYPMHNYSARPSSRPLIMLFEPNKWEVTKVLGSKRLFQFVNPKTQTGGIGSAPSIYSDYKLKGLYNLKFQSKEEMHTFLRQVDGIIIPRKKKDAFSESSLEEIVIDTDLSLLTVHAGVGEVLTIKGSGFGTEGNILFVNADDPTSTMFPRLDGLDDIYVKLWTDTEIQVIVPSFVKEGVITDGEGAGSGTIVVQRTSPDFKEKESSTALNIEYSISNYGLLDNSGFYPVGNAFLGLDHCINGFVFTLHKSFEGNYPAIFAVESALSAWASYLNITLELERLADGKYAFQNKRDLKGRNIISFDPTIDFSAGKRMNTTPTIKWDNYTSAQVERVNIKIGVSEDWEYSISGDSDKTEDFYAAFLHEVGHALGLEHDLDLDNGDLNLMNPNPAIFAFGLIGEVRVNLNQDH